MRFGGAPVDFIRRGEFGLLPVRQTYGQDGTKLPPHREKQGGKHKRHGPAFGKAETTTSSRFCLSKLAFC